MYRTDMVTPAPTSWDVVFDPTAAQPYSGQDHRLRQPDLHRGRRAVPQDAQARAGHHRPLRADPAAVRRGRRAAQGSSARASASTGPPSRTRSTTSPTARPSSARPGRTSTTPSPASGVPVEASRAERGDDRLGRHLDAVDQGRAPELHAQVDGVDADPRGADAGRRVLRRGARQPQGVHSTSTPATAPTSCADFCTAYSVNDQLLQHHRVLEDPAAGLRRRRGADRASTTRVWTQKWTEIKG